ncbi:MAG TPA: UDP-N-acetylmuramoyl-tripeptide--D-alanyl-D-alanine ligase [Actinomycetota bacterium]|nr:UDP-N-acetylmuramoyl-tripeptide--D-alanyl-D-alanine ligase [Actinomycetota bacterium]
MRRRSLAEIAGAVEGAVAGEDVSVSRVAVDSHEVTGGDLFVALRGERVDGHDFVDGAFAAGAAAALVDRPVARPHVLVADTEDALRRLAVDERTAMSATVIGITGSTGKTSVKDLTAAILGMRFRVSASPRSFNTEVGVPVTLLNADPEADVVVCEMGSRGLGHIRSLTEVARPVVGVVTNVGLAHLEMFGSPENVANAKAELVEALPAAGTAVLNADDPVVRSFAERTAARVVLFGTEEGTDVRGEDLRLDETGRPSFTLRTADGAERVDLPVAGEHMAWNALAAAGAGVALGLTAGECAAGLKEARISGWRMEIVEASAGYRIVNDAYNANPTSMAAALKAAAWMARDGRSIAVLGHMAELGPIADREHERVGELAARLGIDRLVVVGPEARRIAVGAIREGVEPDRVTEVASVEEAASAVREAVRPGDVVLLKGSRVAGLERVAEAIA